MYRAQPNASKLLSKKWRDQEQAIHMEKLRNIKSTVKVAAPTQFRHLKTKPKKTQMLEGT